MILSSSARPSGPCRWASTCEILSLKLSSSSCAPARSTQSLSDSASSSSRFGDRCWSKLALHRSPHGPTHGRTQSISKLPIESAQVAKAPRRHKPRKILPRIVKGHPDRECYRPFNHNTNGTICCAKIPKVLSLGHARRALNSWPEGRRRIKQDLCNATIANKHGFRSCCVEQDNVTTRDSPRPDPP